MNLQSKSTHLISKLDNRGDITMTYGDIGCRTSEEVNENDDISTGRFFYSGYLCVPTLNATNAVTQSFIWNPTEFTEGEQTSFYSGLTFYSKVSWGDSIG